MARLLLYLGIIVVLVWILSSVPIAQIEPGFVDEWIDDDEFIIYEFDYDAAFLGDLRIGGIVGARILHTTPWYTLPSPLDVTYELQIGALARSATLWYTLELIEDVTQWVPFPTAAMTVTPANTPTPQRTPTPWFVEGSGIATVTPISDATVIVHVEPWPTQQLGAGMIVLEEVLSGAVDGVNTTYTTVHEIVPDQFIVSVKDGLNAVLRQSPDTEIILSGTNEITITPAIDPVDPYTGLTRTVEFICDYITTATEAAGGAVHWGPFLTPTPANTATPMNTPTPALTSTPASTVTPLATAVLTPQSTPTPAKTSTPAKTPTPMNTPTPASTPTEIAAAGRLVWNEYATGAVDGVNTTYNVVNEYTYLLQVSVKDADGAVLRENPDPGIVESGTDEITITPAIDPVDPYTGESRSIYIIVDYVTSATEPVHGTGYLEGPYYSPTPANTATPIPADTPRATVTPANTVTPFYTTTPVNTPTPLKTPTPIPDSVLTPRATSTPANTPTPAATPTPVVISEQWVIGELATGDIDGANTVFDTANNYVSGKLIVGVYDGIFQYRVYPTPIDANSFAIGYAISPVDPYTGVTTGVEIRVDYIKE